MCCKYKCINIYDVANANAAIFKMLKINIAYNNCTQKCVTKLLRSLLQNMVINGNKLLSSSTK